MKIEVEPFHPRRELINFVEDCTKGIEPDVTSLCDWHNSYSSNHKFRVAFDYDLIQQNVIQNSRLLEFGSIPLILTATLCKSQFEVTGVDIAPESYKSSIDHLEITILQCDIESEKLPIESDSYDAALFFELFEHLRIDIVFTMREVLRILKPNGILLLSSPNLKSLGGLNNFLLHNYSYSSCGNLYEEYQKLEKLGHMGHVREYTSREVVEFLRNIGFKTEKLIYRGRYYSKTAHIVTRFFPMLRPFITYIAQKA